MQESGYAVYRQAEVEGVPPHIPPPEGWEAAGEAVERGNAAATERAARAAEREPYFDAPETLPTDELITAGAPVPEDSVAGVVGAVGAPSGEKAGLRGGMAHTFHLDELAEAVTRAAERAAEALRISSEEGTRGTP